MKLTWRSAASQALREEQLMRLREDMLRSKRSFSRFESEGRHQINLPLREIIMRRYERFSTLLTSNRPVEDWGKLLGDVAAVSAMLDRLLHHGDVLKCGPRSWRTKTAAGGGQ